MWVSVVFHTCGGHSATLSAGGGVGPCGGVLIMGRLLGCAVRNVPRFRKYVRCVGALIVIQYNNNTFIDKENQYDTNVSVIKIKGSL